MYQGQSGPNNTNKPQGIAKKWPPVSTNYSPSVPAKPQTFEKPSFNANKPVTPTKPSTNAKPSFLHSSINSTPKNSTPKAIIPPKPLTPKPFGVTSNSQQSTVPSWKKDFKKSNEDLTQEKENHSQSNGTIADARMRFSQLEKQNQQPDKPSVASKPKPLQTNKPWMKPQNTDANEINKPPFLPTKPKPVTFTPPPPTNEIVTPSSPKTQRSFIHRNNSPNSSTKHNDLPPPPVPSSYPRRREIPSDVYDKSPPTKPYKPPGVNLRAFNQKNRLPPLPKSPNIPLPSIPGGTPARNLSSSSSLTGRQLPLTPNSPVNRPLPPPNAGTIKPNDDSGDEIYDLPPEDNSPSPVPPVPGGYPSGNPPQLPPPRTPVDVIPEWEDEYDDTEAAPPPGSYVATDGEIYEDMEEYMKFKQMKGRLSARNNSQTSEDPKVLEKRRKEAEKKDKKMRKEFKLAKEGHIQSEAHGFIKADSKGGGKDLQVSQSQPIDIIRMDNNPKGKWLIRNSEGIYGYVDSENVRVDIGELKTTFNNVGGQPDPPPIPTFDEEEECDVIYDQTPDDDVYEEF